MKTVPFTVEGCKSNNNQAVTRDGGRVNVVGYDNPFHLNREYCLIGYIENRVYPSSWTISGTCAGGDSHHDIFLPAPEPKLRPWTIKEVPHLAMVRRIGDSEAYGTIVGIAIGGVVHVASGGPWLLKELITSYEHSTDHGVTWYPCGVEE